MAIGPITPLMGWARETSGKCIRQIAGDGQRPGLTTTDPAWVEEMDCGANEHKWVMEPLLEAPAYLDEAEFVLYGT